MHFSSFNNTDDFEDLFGNDSESVVPTIPKLSEGALLKIHRGSKEEKNLIFQVLKFNWMPLRKRYKLDVSDGQYSISTAILDKDSSNLIKQNHIDELSVINIKR